MTKWVLYDLILDGEVVYVGTTSRPRERLSTHRGQAYRRGWMHMKRVEMKIVDRFARRPAALKAESERIRQLMPVFNVNEHPECFHSAAGRRARLAIVRREHEARALRQMDQVAADAAKLNADLERELRVELGAMKSRGASPSDMLAAYPWLGADMIEKLTAA